jgi:cytoskeletal protein RodZ
MAEEIETKHNPKDQEPALSLGQYLQRERQKKQLSIKDIAQATKIPAEALKALEEGNKKQLPVTIFTKGFVKIYGQHLGLNQNDVLDRFHEEWLPDADNSSPTMLQEESMAQLSPFYLSLKFYVIIIAIILLLGLAYFFFNANDPNSQEFSLNNVREMQTLPPAIITNQERISISGRHLDSKTTAQTLISPKSAGKIAQEEDSEDIILADLASILLVQKKAPVAPVTHDSTRQSGHAVTTEQVDAPPVKQLAQVQPEPRIKEQFSNDELPGELAESLPLDLHIAFLARTRISISQDEERPAKYIFTTGDESSWQADKTISMLVEKSENIRITLNGKLVSLPASQNTPLAITLPADLHKL